MYQKWLAVLLLLFPAVVAAQDGFEPGVDVSDQASVGGTVQIDRVESDGPGWLVIHADDDGDPGEVIGYRAVRRGSNLNFQVEIEPAQATLVLHAMLHHDDGTLGEFEFGTEDGVDTPVLVDTSVVNESFRVDAVYARNQFVTDGTVTVPVVLAQEEGWLVVYADNGEGAPGDILGMRFVADERNTNVVVELEDEPTDTLFFRLHEDTGVADQYEYGVVENTDVPVIVNGEAVTTSIRTVPSIQATQQIASETFVADSVLSDGPGWLVIHANADGAPGQVIGAEFVEDGYNTEVAVSLNTAGLTPVVYPMLHQDTGEIGTYEFGEVEGEDAPVQVNDSVLTFPMIISPSITALPQPVQENGSINIATALIDDPGWLVVHADDDEGNRGTVIGVSPLMPGLNENVGVQLLTGEPTATVYPTLYTDNEIVGEFKLGDAADADTPVRVNDAVVSIPLTIEGVE